MTKMHMAYVHGYLWDDVSARTWDWQYDHLGQSSWLLCSAKMNTGYSAWILAFGRTVSTRNWVRDALIHDVTFTCIVTRRAGLQSLSSTHE